MVGKLIVFEGLDSSGKATQTELLIKKLKQQNIPVEKADFPQYGSWSCAFVEKYLNGEFGAPNNVNPQAASVFYALDRFAKRQQLSEWLAQGKIIIANRYVTSNQAYQGGKIHDAAERKKFLAWLDELEYTILGLPRPTLVIYLRVPLAVTQALLEKRRPKEYIKDGKKDVHEKDKELLKATAEVYEHLAMANPEWRIIECAEDGQLLSKESIHERVWEKAEKIIE